MCFSHGLANPLVRLKPSGCSPPSCLLCATLLDDHSSKQKYGVYQETIVLHLTASRTPLPSSLTSEYFFLAYFFLKHENDEKQCLFSAQNNSFESFTDKNHCFWSNTSSLFPAHSDTDGSQSAECGELRHFVSFFLPSPHEAITAKGANHFWVVMYCQSV